MKIVLLNGPPGSGKDAAGRALAQSHDAKLFKFATALKEATHALFGMPGIVTDAFEAVKNEPSPQFLGLSPREAYTKIAEAAVKPAFGAEIFGQLLTRQLALYKNFCSLAVITDSGFASEAAPVVREFGAKNVLLLRCHRPGKSFAGDSRGYLELEGVATIDLCNDQDLVEWYALVRVTVTFWLERD